MFFGTGQSKVMHVGIYLAMQAGQALMVDAPHESADVRVEPFVAAVGARWGSEVSLGAIRGPSEG